MGIMLLSVQSAWAVLPEKNLNRLVVSLGRELEMHTDDFDNVTEDLSLFITRLLSEIHHSEENLDMAHIVLSSHENDALLSKIHAVSEAREVIAKTNETYEVYVAMRSMLNDHVHTIASIRQQLADVNTQNLSNDGLACLNNNIRLCDELSDKYDSYFKELDEVRTKFREIKQKADALEADIDGTLDLAFRTILQEPQIDYIGFLEKLVYFFSGAYVYDSPVNDQSQLSAGTMVSEQATAYKWKQCRYIVALVSMLIVFIVLRIQKKSATIRNNSGGLALIASLFVFISIGFIELLVEDHSTHIRNGIILGMQFCAYAALIVGVQILSRTKVCLRYIFMLYVPQLLLIGFITNVVIRLFPLSTIEMVLPVVYILYLIVDSIILLFIWKKIKAYQRISSIIHFAFVILCLFVANHGYYVASIILYQMWFSLFCIILMLYTISTYTGLKNKIKSHFWVNYTFAQLVYPLLPIILIAGSLYWVADIFDLSAWFVESLKHPIINIPDVCKASVWNLLYAIILGITIRFVIKSIKKILLHINPEKYSSGNAAVAVTLMAILVWFLFALFVVLILNINKASIIAAIGGASIGLGFALRDTFENFFYGFSMMSGRLRPGDIVGCDGLRGVVASVGIMSTSITTEDGPVVSMPNRQLFARHFINYSRNHCHEIRHIIFDITQGSNIDLARELMLKSAQGSSGVVDYEKHYVVVKYISCGIVRLDYKCWIDSATYLRSEPAVREAIYHAFKENGIEIADFTKSMDMRASAKIMEQTPLV